MKLMFIIISIILFQTAGYCLEPPKDVPEGLYKALYAKLNEGDYLKNSLRRFGFDTTITVDEIDPGIPVQYFFFKGYSRDLEEMEDIDINAPVMSLVEPAGTWKFILKARGKYIIDLLFHKENGTWQWGATGGGETIWEDFWDEYSESKIVRPVVIVAGNRGYLHLPHINDKNLTLMLTKKSRDRIKRNLKMGRNSRLSRDDSKRLEEDAAIMSDSYDSTSLVDSRVSLSVIRQRLINVKKQKALKNHGRVK